MHILDDLVVERATVTLRHRGATAFHFYHGGRLMGLLMRAWDPSPAHRLPVGLVPVPVERGVVEYSAGEAYRFGVVHVGREPFDWERLWHGMQRVGMAADHGGSTPWHFSVGDTAVERLPRATELAASLGGQQGALLLRLLTPLRLMRPNAEQRPGHGYLDGDWFCARTFLRRVASRQLRLLLGVQPSEGDLAQLPPPLEGAAATPGRLWWLDLTRGAERKPTGGVVGRVLLDGIDEHWLPWLALLPWSHVGEGTHFGYGRVEVSRNGVTPGPSAAWPPPCTTLLDRALEPQALREAAQVLAGVHTEGAGHGASSGNPLLRAQRLGALARSGRLRAWPLTGVILPKPEGGVRAIAFPAMAERILQRAAGRVLARGIDELHEDASFGYRQRLSHGSAARAVARAGRDGLRHVVDADVSAFFDSVDLSHLEAKLEAFLPQEPLVPLLMAWLRAPVHFDGEIIRRERGLPQGLPISPVLANFLLDELDEAVQGAGFRLVRYADDFVICCRTEDEARRAHALVADVLARMGLVLHPTKTRVTTFAEGFRFVGHLFRHDQVTEVAPSSAPTPSADGPRAEWTPPEHSWLARVPASRLRELVERRRGRWEARVGTGAAREDSPVDADRVVALAALDTPRAGTGRPLWVLEQGVRVRRGGERLLVEREESLQEYPMRALSHVVIGSGVRITVPALLRLADLQVPVFVLRRDGGLRARVGTAMADWPLWEAQARVARDPGARLAAARAIVAAKVAN